MRAEATELLIKSAGLYASIDSSMAAKLLKHMELLLEWNKKMNLTTITEEQDVIIKHFADSLSILPMLQKLCLNGGSLVDVGTGAGFPGIPVKVVCENIKVTLLDSLEKRIKFLNAVIEATELKGIEAVHARAEDSGSDSKYRERFDAATARAVAPLNVLAEYCLPFVKKGGIFVAMKGSIKDETLEAKKAIAVLGGELAEVTELTLPFSDFKRTIIVINKIKATPSGYPRKAGRPSKEPIK